MCGIAGFFDESVNNFNLIKSITNQIKHRGPDSTGFYNNKKGLHLGMCRLSIIGLKSGNQPVINDKSVIVFNGEIFNFLELKNKYLSDIKKIDSDTQVISHLYNRKGLSILDELNGFFSISIYDKVKKKLFLIRDRYGIKPLYYFEKKNVIYFCSELNPLKKVLKLSNKNLNIEQVNNFFVLGYILGEDRIYNNLKMLNAGCYIEYDLKNKNKKIIKWHNIKKLENIFFEKKNDLIKTLEEKIFNAVNLWTRSDVDKIFSLSGGIDSSILATIYANQEKKINTISFVYKNDKYKNWNESLNSDLVAKNIGSNHQKYFWSAKDLKNDLENIILSLEEPFGNSILPWFLYKQIRKDYKVCITGNGGDELFGNYMRVENYKKLSGNFYNKKNFENNYLYKNYYFDLSFQNKYLNHKTKNISDIFYKMLIRNKNYLDKERNLALLDYLGQFKDDMLFSEDKISMRNSVEARTPYLDNNLFKFVYSLKNQRIKDGNYKYLLKNIGKKILPKNVLNDKKKGFNMPISIFLRENFHKETKFYLSKKNLNKVGFINGNFFEEIVEPMLRGKNENIQIIWNILVFHIWFNAK